MATKTAKTVELVEAHSHASAVAHDEYAVANLKNVKEVFVGRGQSVVHESDLANGAITYLGDLVEGETHIFDAESTGEGLPWVMFRPEIIAKESSRMDKQLGIFRMKGGKAQPAWQLNLLDKIEYSECYFAETPVLGDIFEIKTLGTKFVKNPSATGLVFKVVEINETRTPVAYSGSYELMPAARKMYTVQLINKKA